MWMTILIKPYYKDIIATALKYYDWCPLIFFFTITMHKAG